MKKYTLLFLSLFLITVTLHAQRDTVFVDINDSTVFKNLPPGYSIIDTIENKAYSSLLITGTVGMNNSPNNNWNGVVPNLPDSLQNLFVYWGFSNSNGTCTGVAKFRKDGVLLDSLILTNDSIPVNYSDTFPSGSFDTLQYKAQGFGPDTIEFKIGFFQIRTEIRISKITSIDKIAISEEKISIFPNPSQSFIQFNYFESVQSELYQLFNVNGKLMNSGSINENRLDVSMLPSGLYFIQIPDKQIAIKFQKM